MDEIPSIKKTLPAPQNLHLALESLKLLPLKVLLHPLSPQTRPYPRPSLIRPGKEKAQKVKPKVKTKVVKAKKDKVQTKTQEAVVIKEKDPSSSTSSVAKPVKTIKANPEDNFNSTTPKKEKSKSSTVRPPLLKTPPLSSQTLPLPHPSLHDGPRLSHDIRARRDLPPGSGLLPISHQHGLPLIHQPPSPLDGGRRMGEEGRSLLGPPPGKLRRMGEEGRSLLGLPPGKLRRIDGLGGCSDALPQSHMSHQPPFHRLQLSSDRPGLPPLTGSHEMIQGDADRRTIRPLIDLPVGLILKESAASEINYIFTNVNSMKTLKLENLYVVLRGLKNICPI